MIIRSKQMEVTTDGQRGHMITSLREPGRPNVIDADDNGRGIQSSWYGMDNYGYWAGQPWPWNPVQGGGYKDEWNNIVKQSERTDRWATSAGFRDWSTGKNTPLVNMTQSLAIQGPILYRKAVLEISNDALYGSVRHQEEPAIFVLPKYRHVVTGGDPVGVLLNLRNGANQYGTLRGGWVGLVDRTGYGIYLKTTATEWTGYRVSGRLSCAYMAPIKTYALGRRQEYENAITVGTRAHALRRLGYAS